MNDFLHSQNNTAQHAQFYGYESHKIPNNLQCEEILQMAARVGRKGAALRTLLYRIHSKVLPKKYSTPVAFSSQPQICQGSIYLEAANLCTKRVSAIPSC